ncbi:small T-antigen [Bat mastadenovirus WIV13]|uniref:E1B protein, small T-antigen n=1 Tax=Bat mastadenovirus WIV13 TaxID=1788435 RepID=A0A1B0UHW6_9ADEN|nr:small T-antigen [Bat mastadenovirus WIV13]AMB43018.1 small T-antigen [Bat mastadenovirus WIV13]
MEANYIQYLKSYSDFRDLLNGASARTGFLYRWLFCDKLTYWVYRVKIENRVIFEEIVKDFPETFFESLEAGYTCDFEDSIVPQLEFLSLGHTLSSLAFVVFLIDYWKENSVFSWDFIIESFGLITWRAIIMAFTREKLL